MSEIPLVPQNQNDTSQFPVETPVGSVPTPLTPPEELPTAPNERTLRAVLIDIDGTLLDSNDAHARAWADAFAEDGKPVDLPTIRKLIGMGSDQMLPAYCGVESQSDAGKKLSRRWEYFFRERYLPTLRPFSGARSLLETLAGRGLLLVVATSAKKEMAQELLQIIQVEDLVDTLISADDAARSKPEPDIVGASLEALQGAHPDEVLLLGDTPYDIAAAAKAGVRTIAVRSGGWNDADLGEAIAIYDNVAELLAQLEDSPLGHARPVGG